MKSLLISTLTALALGLGSCREKTPNAPPPAGLLNDPALLHQSVKKLTDVIVYDIFTPPVASRIYAYSTLAAYEAVRFDGPQPHASITAQLNGFPDMPEPEKGKSYLFALAGVKAMMTVGQQLTFSKDTLRAFEQALYGRIQEGGAVDEETFQRSVDFGQQIGQRILVRALQDQYKETRGMARYSVTRREGFWEPTTPDYMDAVEPFWGKIRVLAMDSANQFQPDPPLTFSRDPKSTFWKELLEVYELGKTLTEEQREIARFWDCNPFVSQHTGHLTAANKKMTPGGHWIAIAGLAAKQTNASLVKTAQTYALTAVALFDGFISCWEEKFRSQTVRPVTLIQKHIDRRWEPYLQTPPFPEYTSGHSVISASAATVLTHLYGDSLAFRDTTELEYGMGERSFNSFYQASDEAGISRVYGGIHYRTTCVRGAEQGRKVGKWLVDRVRVAP
jgi:hypothetical protein